MSKATQADQGFEASLIWLGGATVTWIIYLALGMWVATGYLIVLAVVALVKGIYAYGVSRGADGA